MIGKMLGSKGMMKWRRYRSLLINTECGGDNYASWLKEADRLALEEIMGYNHDMDKIQNTLNLPLPTNTGGGSRAV